MLTKTSLACLLIASFIGGSEVRADGPSDNIPTKVRRIPRLGIDVPEEKRGELEVKLAELDTEIEKARGGPGSFVTLCLADVQIFAEAVRNALQYQEFFHPREIDGAFELLDEGLDRARQLQGNAVPTWVKATGLVVRGYVSRIDGSVQPYGLVVPDLHEGRGHRLDVWFHGRGETLSELNFLLQRRKQKGQYAPPGAFVLHPYGRYSNAFKFAGEVDVFEALADVQRNYRIDRDRIAVRGFSMGGAGCWQMAVHHADRWFAANPGAGFSETPEFLKFFQKETLNPTWYEKKLWQLYDCTDWAANLFHCPTVAYSGELDVQKQAADIMTSALEREKLSLVHVIGPGTKHRIHPDSGQEIERRLMLLEEVGRERTPRRIRFTTCTLKYPGMHWLTVEGLGEHWERARVEAVAGDSELSVTTKNVTDLAFYMPPGRSVFPLDSQVRLLIDGQELAGPRPGSDRSWSYRVHREGLEWREGTRSTEGLRKRHDLQGPVDDAFMDSFIFVRPTGKPAHELPGSWAESELERAIEHWRRHFRGHARVKKDTEITQEDMAGANLILWGDPSSNAVLAKVAGELPIRWDSKAVTVGEKTYAADHHALIAIYPNPLAPGRYVVLNSSFTFREYAYLNNARQVPKLPDWAVIDLRTPPDTLWPGKVVNADFFGERWELRPARYR